MDGIRQGDKQRVDEANVLCLFMVRNMFFLRWSFWPVSTLSSLAHVPAKWIRFADKDMRQHENLRRFPVILDHSVIQYDRKAL
jgi:hypothetical protein